MFIRRKIENDIVEHISLSISSLNTNALASLGIDADNAAASVNKRTVKFNMQLIKASFVGSRR